MLDKQFKRFILSEEKAKRLLKKVCQKQLWHYMFLWLLILQHTAQSHEMCIDIIKCAKIFIWLLLVWLQLKRKNFYLYRTAT